MIIFIGSSETENMYTLEVSDIIQGKDRKVHTNNKEALKLIKVIQEKDIPQNVQAQKNGEVVTYQYALKRKKK